MVAHLGGMESFLSYSLPNAVSINKQSVVQYWRRCSYSYSLRLTHFALYTQPRRLPSAASTPFRSLGRSPEWPGAAPPQLWEFSSSSVARHGPRPPTTPWEIPRVGPAGSITPSGRPGKPSSPVTPSVSFPSPRLYLYVLYMFDEVSTVSWRLQRSTISPDHTP